MVLKAVGPTVVLVLLVLLSGPVSAADEEGLDTQTQLYIISGVLGGVALILTIVSVYITLTLIGVQSEVKKLKAAASKAAAEPVTEIKSPSGSDNPLANTDDYARNAYEDVRRPGPSGAPRSAPPPRDA